MSVTRDEVILAYKLILGREAESEDVIRAAMSAADLQVLRTRFLDSREFRERSDEAPTHLPVLPVVLPRLDIDTDATDQEMAAAIRKIKIAWTHLGRARPHHSVLTHSDYLPENFGETSQELFWASGRQQADSVTRLLGSLLFGNPGNKTCVDYGCGVGRISAPLALKFRKVHGYDISSTHLALAAERARALGIGNLVLHECSDDLLLPLEACDLFYSKLVFQHNPPIIIARLLRNALWALRPAGIAIFQLLTYRVGYRFKTREWLAASHALDMQMHCIPQETVFRIILENGCVVLQVREDNSAGLRDVFLSNVFVVRKPD